MAILIRDKYSSIPNMVSTPAPTTFNGGLVGSTVSQNAVSTYIGNKYLNTEASSNFYVTNPLTNYNTFQREYASDTGQWGMLASFYVPNTRYAQSLNVRDIYATNLTSIGGSSSGLGVNVGVNWQLFNQQQEYGTVSWYRKLAQDIDMGPYSRDISARNTGYDTSLSFLASRNPQFGKTYYQAKADAGNIYREPFKPSISTSYSPDVWVGKRISVTSIKPSPYF